MGGARAHRVSRRMVLAAAAGLVGAAALGPSTRAQARGLGTAFAASGAPISLAAASGVPTAPAAASGTMAAPLSQATPVVEVIGASSGGIPLTAYWLGEGATPVIVQGAIHGGYEVNTSWLTFQLRDYYQAHPDEIPASLRIAFMPEANPDGIALDSRFYLSNVDPNRNWDTADWVADAYDGDGRLRHNLGGTAPMSEPETRAMAAWFLALRPAVVVQYHSQGSFVVGTRELAEPYAAATGYRLPTPGGGLGGLLPYRATGTMGRWLSDNNLGSVLIETANHHDPEFDRNLRGLRAVLRAVTTG
jgi:murein peptide amidase A